MHGLQIFSPIAWLAFFTLFIVSLDVRKFFYFDVVRFISCSLCCLYFGVTAKKSLPNPVSWRFSAVFPLRSPMVFALLFRPLIHFELVFVCGTGEGLPSFFCMWRSVFPRALVGKTVLSPHWMVLAPVSKSFHIYWEMWGFISGLSILFHLSLCQYLTVLITIVF